MKSLQHLMIVVCLTATMDVHAAEEPSNNEAESAGANKPGAEDLALVKRYLLKGRIEQSIGRFGGFSELHAGDTFELDLANLPREPIKFTRSPANPGQPSAGICIPLQVPLEIVKVKKERGHVSIDLSPNETYGKFLIQIVANLQTDKGNSAYLTFYRVGENGLIGERSMAEARGELKVKEPAPSTLQPKTNEPARQDTPEDAPPFKPGIKNLEPPIGSLGYKIGSYLTIEGAREDRAKGSNRTLRVDTINGTKLDQPIAIWMEGVELPEKERCIFKGYETGEWIGVPDEVLRATGKPAPQAGWQFRFSFATTSIEQPKNLEIQ